MLGACSASDTEKAQALYDQAKTALDRGDYRLTLSLVDSIKKAYPSAIEVRRGCLFLSRRAIELGAVGDLSRADSLKVTLEARADSMKSMVALVNAEGDQVYVATGVNPRDAFTSTGLQGRVTPQGAFYIIGSLRGAGFVPSELTANAGGESLSVSAPVDRDALSHRTGVTEVMTLQGQQADTLGRFFADHQGTAVSLTYSGQGRSAQATLAADRVLQLARTYEFYATMRQFRVATLEQQRLTRVVETARNQAAKTFEN